MHTEIAKLEDAYIDLHEWLMYQILELAICRFGNLCTNDLISMQAQLLDPAVKGTMHVLQAAQKAKVKRVVLTSSISAIIPSPNWPANVPKDENCWTDLDYCKDNGVIIYSLVLPRNEFDWTVLIMVPNG
jgi:hypothetical protein